MLIDKSFQFGKVSGVIYDMEFKGDELAEHTHSESDCHFTICAKGSVEIITPEWTRILQAGNIIEFFPLQPHTIRALEDNSRVINVIK